MVRVLETIKCIHLEDRIWNSDFFDIMRSKIHWEASIFNEIKLGEQKISEVKLKKGRDLGNTKY